MSRIKLGSNSTYISKGNSLNYIGNHAYAYNSNSFNNIETTILQFDTGKKYVLGKMQFGVDNYDGDDIELSIYLNGIKIMDNRSAVAGKADQMSGGYWQLLIPSNTLCEIKLQNRTDSSSYTGYITFTGEIYG